MAPFSAPHTPCCFCRWMLQSAHSTSLSAEPSPFLLSITVLLPRVGVKAVTHLDAHAYRTAVDTDADRCRKRAAGLTCVDRIKLKCSCVDGRNQSAGVQNIACQESPRESFFVGPPRDPAYTSLHRQRKPDIDHLSTSHHPPPLLLTPPSNHAPFNPNPISDTGPGKRERRAGDRHEMWHEMQKRSPSDTYRRLSLPAKPTVWLTSGMPCRTRGSCS